MLSGNKPTLIERFIVHFKSDQEGTYIIDERAKRSEDEYFIEGEPTRLYICAAAAWA